MGSASVSFGRRGDSYTGSAPPAHRRKAGKAHAQQTE